MALAWTSCTHQSHATHYPENSKTKQLRHGSLMQTRCLQVHQTQLQHQPYRTRNTEIITIVDTIATIVVIATAIDLVRRLRKLER